jgi:hypothetical protein
MSRPWVALCALLLITLGLAPHVALAKDEVLRITLDGRPLDARSPSGMVHHGVAFINVVRATRAFDGLLVFAKDSRSVRVTIRQHHAEFVIGQLDGMLLDRPTTFSAAPFSLYGDIYVPLTAIAVLADARLSVDVRRHTARLTTRQSFWAPAALAAWQPGLRRARGPV